MTIGTVRNARITAPSVSIHSEDQRIALTVEQTYSLGRRAESDVIVNGPEVSREHATLVVDPAGAVWLTDLGSRNGTFVDGRPIRPHTATQVQPGSHFQLGSTTRGRAFRLDVEPDLIIDLEHATSTVIPHQTVTIGRAPDNTLQLPDPQVSRHHARATPHGESFLVEDLGSHNGTFLDGRRIGAEMAGEGSLVTVGRSSFLVQAGNLVHWTQTSSSLRADRLTVTVGSRNSKTILDDVSFDLNQSQLMAVIGPSGAGKTTLLRALTGSRPASQGTVWCDGRDLYRQYEDLKHRIGVVPQDDIVHAQLSVADALRFAAELRFSDDLDPADRMARVDDVLAQLQLTEHRNTRVSRLSGGQRKRVSVAMELLTEPSLIFLDEPTSGLDPGLDKTVMRLLRDLADGGRTVVVITHNTANLDLCDKVLLLAPRGGLAYDGPPAGLMAHIGATDMAEVFQKVSDNPSAFRQHPTYTSRPTPTPTPAPGAPRRRNLRRQVTTLMQRQVKLVTSDRSYALATLVLPAVLALMTLAIPGDTGFARPARGPRPTQANDLLVVMMVGAAFMGSAAAIRELVGERAIFLRERAVGLSPAAYLGSKVVFTALLTFVQACVLVGLVLLAKPGPGAGVLMPGWAELVVAAGLTALAAACISLLLSAWAGSADQVMPALVITVMAQLVLCGGLIEVTERAGLEQLSWLTPARWGFAAAASTVELRRLSPIVPDDVHWRHTVDAWSLDTAALTALCVVSLAWTLLRLRRTRPTV